MLHEYLFRGKRLDNGAWVIGSLFLHSEECFICCLDPLSGDLNRYAVDPSTVGQYTELDDHRKQKIFDGDILSVRQHGGEEYRFLVVFGPCGGVQNTDHEVGYVGFHLVAANESTEYCARYGLRNDLLYWLDSGSEVVVAGDRWDNAEI